ncbi:MAG: O-antigen ligase family protein [Gemmatimonadota bacterium]
MRLALFLLVLVSIARIQFVFPVLLPLRLALLSLAVATGFAVLSPNAVAWKNVFATWMGVAMGAYGFATIVSAFAGISLGASATYLIEEFSRTLVATFIFLAGIRDARDLWFFLWAYVISMGSWAYLSFFYFETTSEGSQVDRLSDLYTYDANDLGVVLLMGVAFIFMVLPAASKWVRRGLWVLLVSVVGTLALTGSRGAFLGAGVLAVFMLFTLHDVQVWKRVATAFAMVLALLIAAPEGYWDQMSTILEPSDDYNVTDVDGRWQILKRGVTYVVDHPVFGVGPENFGRAEYNNPEKRAMVPFRTGIRMVSPHNTYLQVAAELGLVGLGIWLYILGRGFFESYGLRKRLPKQWKTGSQEERFLYATGYFFPVAFIGFAVPSTFVSFAYSAPPFILFAYYGAYLRVLEDRFKEDRRQARRRGVIPPHSQAGAPGGHPQRLPPPTR